MKNADRQAQQLVKSSRSRRRWRRTTAGISGLVILGTLVALMLPAVAMEGTCFCGEQEHVHADSCYVQKLVCTQEEGVQHAHTDACYGPEEEILACEKHVHTEECYRTEQTASCQPHTHGDGCYTAEQALICQDAAHHDHTDACYQDGTLVCGFQSHGEGCYETKQVLTCTMPEHVCTDACSAPQETRVLVCTEPEHVHDAACYKNQRPLVCTQSTDQPHVHTDTCYETVLICTQQEHAHTLACQSNPQADTELPEQWEQSLPQELTGRWAEDVAAIAQSQVGYAQSEKNFAVAEDGVTQHFYSRYGAWYGQPYAPWSALFAAFCLHYAGVEGLPVDPDPAIWVQKLSGEWEGFESCHFYRPADAAAPQPGELAFLDSDGDGQVDAVAVVTGFFPGAETTHTMLETIWGDGEVKRKTYDLEQPEPEDAVILGYAALPPQPEQIPTEPTESTEPTEAGALLTQTVQGADFSVTVAYPADALPEGAQLRTEEYAKDSSTYQARYAEAVQLYGWSEDHTAQFRLFHIGFYLEGVEVEPTAPVRVQLSYPGQEAMEHQVTHYGQLEQQAPVQAETTEPTQSAQADAPEQAEVPTEQTEPTQEQTHQVDASSQFADGTQTVEFEVSRFSDFGVLAVAPTLPLATGQEFVLYNAATRTILGNQIPKNDKGEAINGNLEAQPVELLKYEPVGRDGFYKAWVSDPDVFDSYPKWKFETVQTGSWWPTTKDCLTTTIDGKIYYLKIVSTKGAQGLSLVADASEATDLTATKNQNGAIRFHSGNTSINKLGGTAGGRHYGTYTSAGDQNEYFYLFAHWEKQELKTVPGMTPKGTVVNVFDYWVEEQNTPDNKDVENFANKGINSGHSLKFLYSGGNGINDYRFKEFPAGAIKTGIVQNALENGYPVVKDGLQAGIASSPETSQKESLAYLFDPHSNHAGKASYPNTYGLLQEVDGYYVYDSEQNFAQLNPNSREFTLYAEPGVKSQGASQKNGQFFPFNEMKDVMHLGSTDAKLNHYFGLTLASRFVQRYDGYTNSNKTDEMIFEFSGDDDVWIFVNDVLVADLGGIHDAASVSINFATGEVTIKDKGSDRTENIYDKFQAAGKADSVEWTWGWNGRRIFKNDTYHTLRFFYLERGNTDSNLKLKYNLSNYPPTAITKITQYGSPVQGAKFALYRADESYNKQGTPQTFVTDANGEILFTNNEGMPLTVEEIKAQYFGAGGHAVLVEQTVPDGYRKVNNEIHLKYVGSNNPVLICENSVDSGAYAATNLQVSAPNEIRTVDDRLITILNGKETNGTLFAVVLKYASNAPFDEITSQQYWRPLYGNYDDGFTAVDTGGASGDEFIRCAIQAAQKQGDRCTFTLSTSGAMQANLDELPGDITTYYYMTPDKKKTEYTVAYYWTEGTLKDATPANTVRIEADKRAGIEQFAFSRKFGANISVPNMLNRLAVLKTDNAGKPLNGAAFAMYSVREENGDLQYKATNGTYAALDGTETVDSATGVLTLQDGRKIAPAKDAFGQPLTCKTAAATPDAPDMQPGAADFAMFTPGEYVIREFKAPVGYQRNSAEIRVKVTDYAVFVHAGAADDGVVVGRGPGYLAANLREYATLGAVDNTLHWIYTHLLITKPGANFATLNTAIQNSPGGILEADSVQAQRITENRQKVWDETYAQGNPPDAQTLTNFWVYNKKNIGDAFFSYSLDQDESVNAGGYKRLNDRLYTDIGWSWLEVKQNYAYGKTYHSPGAAYMDLSGKDLSHLYSRSIFVEITDQPETCTLEIEKQVVNGTAADEQTPFEFAVALKDDKGNPLTESYSYTIQSKQPDGTWTAGEERRLASGGTIQLTHNQKAVITGIPKDSRYAVTETSVEGYGTQYQIKPETAKAEGLTAEGTMYWQVEEAAESLDAVSHVTFLNTRLPNLTLKKVSDDTTPKALAGAAFTLYREATGGTVKEYFNGKSWVPQGAEKPPEITSNDKGEILLQYMPDGTYYLEERKAPDGYIRFHGRAVIVVADGKIAGVTMENQSTIQPQFKISADGLTLTIPNQAGTMLPETGGQGTWPMTLLGALLTLTAAAFLLRKRKTA